MGPLKNTRPAASVVQLSDYLVPSHRRRGVSAAPAAPVVKPGVWAQAAQARARSRVHTPVLSAKSAVQPRAGAAVRVTRFAEAANAGGPVRHLRLSGRLADVCAELDRLAAAETQLHAISRRA